jgi:hypothetical protein
MLRSQAFAQLRDADAQYAPVLPRSAHWLCWRLQESTQDPYCSGHGSALCALSKGGEASYEFGSCAAKAPPAAMDTTMAKIDTVSLMITSLLR